MYEIDGKKAFLSTPSARRATATPSYNGHPVIRISIHALREEGDPQLRREGRRQGISIHALREEGDVGNGCILYALHNISIHALREEGDYT